MKILRTIILFASLLFGAIIVHGQTASDYIAQGRSYLAASNLVSANLSFSNALVLSPSDPTGNVFYAATRLLVLPSQPIGSNFLTRLGVSAAGRNLYHWRTSAPKDTNGVYLAPAGVDADEATALLRTNILAQIIAAEANLGMVTDTNFTLSLTSQETASTAVTIDYGDIQLLRAMLLGGEYFIYNTYSWNLDVQLMTVRSFYSPEGYSVAGLLAQCPNLLTFASTNDLSAAESAFTNGVSRYLIASEIIRNRPTNMVRLFNYDKVKARDESNFRLTLSDLASSLTNGFVVLEAATNYSVYMTPAFTGKTTLRSLLPQFSGNGFVVGSLPDPTFGGIIQGYTTAMFDSTLAKHLHPIPDIRPASGPGFSFPMYVVTGRGYVVQSSTDLLKWSNAAVFVAATNEYTFTDPAGHSLPRRFYRVVDQSTDMPPPANDNFANRVALSGAPVQSSSYLEDATSENNEPGYGEPSIWWSWTAPASGLFLASIPGSSGYDDVFVYTGTTLDSLVAVDEVNGTNGYYFNGYAFNAVGGTTYQIQVDGFAFGNPDPVRLTIGIPPELSVSSPVDGSQLIAPTNLFISASATKTQSPIAGLQFDAYEGSYPYVTFNASSPASSFSTTFSNVPPGQYNISETASDSFGLSVSAYQNVTVLTLSIATDGLPDGTNQIAYSEPLEATNGHPPYIWSLISGSLPPGLSLANNGLLSGTPTNSGVFNFTVQVTDSISSVATQGFSVTVFGPPSVAIQTTNSTINVTAGGTLELNALVSGIGPMNFQWQFNGTNLPNGIITTIAGQGGGSYSGDGGPATNAYLFSTAGVAVDGAGNIFIADEGNQRVRKVDVNGIITTVAGNGTAGYSGDGGSATNAELNSPYAVAVDATGNLYIADLSNQRVRKVTTNGIISTYAGNGFTNSSGYGGFSGDGGPATNAELNQPSGLAFDLGGNLLIADTINSRIRKVGLDGNIVTIAGGGYDLYNGVPATSAYLYNPTGVAMDAKGNLFIADLDDEMIREVDTNGIMNTIVGDGYMAYSGDGGLAIDAELDQPAGVGLDQYGNLYIADSGNQRIRKVDASGYITTVAGNGAPGYYGQGAYGGDGGQATNAELSLPQGLAFDLEGNMLIADYGNSVIRKVLMQGPQLKLINVNSANSGTYALVVSNPYGSVTSSIVNVSVK